MVEIHQGYQVLLKRVRYDKLFVKYKKYFTNDICFGSDVLF